MSCIKSSRRIGEETKGGNPMTIRGLEYATKKRERGEGEGIHRDAALTNLGIWVFDTSFFFP